MAFNFQRSEYVGIAVGAASGSLVFAALPFIVAAAITTFGDPARAGAAASAELVAMGVASIGVSTGLRSLPGRPTAIVAAALLLAGQVLSGVAIAHHLWSLFIASRLIVGLGEGALYTLCNAFAARATRPDRAFTIVACAQTILNALFFVTLAIVNVRYDPVQTCIIFSVFAALTLPLLLLAPAYRTTDDEDREAEAPRERFNPLARQVLVGFAVYSIALYMLFPYVENIGVTAGYSHSQVATVLAIATLAALMAPVVLAGIGLRYGRLLPILVAIAFQITAAVVLVHSHDLLVWGGAEIVSIVMLYVLTPMMFGLAAHIDPSGRAAAYGSAIMAITAAIGPTISSLVLAFHSSYVLLGWFNAAVYAVMIAILLGPLRRADHQTARKPEAPAAVPTA